MNDHSIQYDIPLPPRSTRPGGPILEKLRALKAAQVGASVFFPGDTRDSVRGAVQRLGARWASCRKVEGGYRVWRVR